MESSAGASTSLAIAISLRSGLRTQNGRAFASAPKGSAAAGRVSMPCRQAATVSSPESDTKESDSSEGTRDRPSRARYQAAVSAGTTFPACRSNS